MTATLEETVTIPASEYADLVECRREFAALRARVSRVYGASKSPIERDAEVAAFIAEAIGRLTAEEVRASCLARFGPERTPSRSAVTRFWQRLRRSAPALRR